MTVESVAMITPYKVRCGIASYSQDLAEALAEQGIDVYIVKLPRFGVKFPEIFNAVAESVPIDIVDIVHVQHEYGLYNNLDEGFYSVLNRLKEIKIDIPQNALAHRPIVTTMHAIGNWGIDRVIAYSSDRQILHNVFCFNRFDFPDKAVIIPHGCRSVECPPKEEAKKVMAVPPDALVVGYCGFVSTYKGLEILIEAMTEIPQAALLMCGGWHTGPDTSYITDLKRRSLELLERRCLWTGYVPEEDLPNAYGAMDIVVYPSKFATESGALLKALGHGKAVIASNIGPFAEKEELGALMTFNDLEDLREKIRLLLTDGDAKRRLEAGARAYAEANSWSKVAKQHIKLYEETLSQTE